MENPDTPEKPETAESFIETPVGLRPDLTMYGIEEYDKGICEDNYKNRAILRKQKFSWNPIYDSEGLPTGRIEVLSHAMQEGRSLSTLEDKKVILEDPRDPNSDYISGLDLMYHHKADELVPPWVMHATRDYERIQDARDAHPEKKIRPNLVAYPQRCRFVKVDGIRCQHWVAGRRQDDGLCRIHLGSVNADAGVGAVAKARARIAQSAPFAVDVLEDLMNNATSEVVRGRAAEQLLDRAGVRGGIEIEHKADDVVRSAGEILAERLDRLKNGMAQQERMIAAASAVPDENGDILDAEVIEDPEPQPHGDTENDRDGSD